MGGGWGGMGTLVFGIEASSGGKTASSAKVVRDVPAVVMLDVTELPHVLPEKVLESDCRGSADLECKSNSKSSIT